MHIPFSPEQEHDEPKAGVRRDSWYLGFSRLPNACECICANINRIAPMTLPVFIPSLEETSPFSNTHYASGAGLFKPCTPDRKHI
jgi:hypothetical protein